MGKWRKRGEEGEGEGEGEHKEARGLQIFMENSAWNDYDMKTFGYRMNSLKKSRPMQYTWAQHSFCVYGVENDL